MKKKAFIISGVLFFIFIFIYWENIAGFYISLYNPFRPKIGNFWKKYEKAVLVDSARNELFEIEKLKSLAKEEEKNYYSNIIKILQATGQMKITKKEFYDFYQQLPNLFIENQLPINIFFEIYTHPHYQYTLLNMEQDTIEFLFADESMKDLGYLYKMDMGELDSAGTTWNMSNENHKEWIILYQDPFQTKIESLSKTSINFHKLTVFLNRKNKDSQIIDYLYLFEWIENIKSVYIVDYDNHVQLLFYIELNSGEYPVYLIQSIHDQYHSLLKEFIRQKEYEL